MRRIWLVLVWAACVWGCSAIGIAQAELVAYTGAKPTMAAYVTIMPKETETPAPTPTPTPAPTATPVPVRYEVHLIPVAEGLRQDQVCPLVIDGQPVQAVLNVPVPLPVEPGKSLVLSLPQGSPLRLAAEDDTAHGPLVDGAYVLTPRPEDFSEPAKDAAGDPVAVFAFTLSLDAATAMPSLSVPVRGGLITPDTTLERGLVVTNTSLRPQEITVTYVADPLRFAAVSVAPEEGDAQLPDGTLRWLRTVPGATWDGQGEVIPAQVTLSFTLRTLPLPADAGLAAGSDTYALAWNGRSLGGTLRTLIAQPRLTMSQHLSSQEALVGDEILLETRVENRGGIAGEAVWMQSVPEGFVYEPGPDAPSLSTDGEGNLLCSLMVPPAQGAAPGAATHMLPLRVTASAGRTRTGGQRILTLSSTLLPQAQAPQPQPPQPLTVLCPDVSARIEAAPLVTRPGGTCALTITLANHGRADGLVALEADLPPGFVLVEDAATPAMLAPVQQGTLLTWSVPVPAAQEGTPGLQTLSYTLQADALPAAVRQHSTPMGLRFAVADEPLQPAAPVVVQVARASLLDQIGGDLWILLPIIALLAAVIVIFLIVLRRK